MIRKSIIAVLAIAALIGAFYFYQKLSNQKTAPRGTVEQKVTQVFTQTIKNESLPINVKTSGNLMARNRMQLFAEVSGVFEHSDKSFKPGIYFAEGETLLRINNEEQALSLKSQRSTLYNQLVLMLPDLRFDYQESLPHWEKYISTFDVNQTLQPLPEPINEKEKLYVVSKNIYTQYYNIKNQEERYSKYVITAPYNGILTEALVDPGTLIRTGQQLGTFISPYTYELEVAVNTSYSDLLKTGTEVKLYNVDRTKTYTGKVIRINSTVDPGSQTIPVFIQVRGDGLKEGMYLEADLEAKQESNVFEIDRKLLINNNSVYQVQDTVLKLVPVETVYFKEKTALIRGLADGTKVLSKSIPGAYEGMLVKEITD